MSPTLPRQMLQMQSAVTAEGQLRLWLETVDTPQPTDNEVLIAVEAAPINPSDIGLLFGAADLAQGRSEGGAYIAPVAPAAMPGMAGRLGQHLPCGNEGAGTVVAAGASPAAQALLGRRVAALGGAMYAQYRAVSTAMCLALPESASAADGASCFVNPLTALGMVDTMRLEGHTALVHTAAASNLGQMLVRICAADGVGLVNIVRSAEQVALLRGIGAQHVVDMTAPDFMAQLTDAVAATGATIGFDATGGGRLGGQILQAMEGALARKATEYNRYGSTTHKQVYLYGNLQLGATEFVRSFGMAWGMGGWLLWPFLNRVGPTRVAELKARVAAELHTTFASHYAERLTLAEAVDAASVARYAKRNTGGKFLIEPQRG